ncbi:MAG: mutator MutT protein [Anaerosporomusa subterranea]|jgi:8-oxo-dGTP diphosphatase|nr:mutator MutT protein [Anaerosporomusa subterranea]
MIQVVAAVIIRGGRCLITRRSPGQNLAGLWEFPGGKLESGETHEDCLRRELREELAINISVGKFIAESCFGYPSGSIHLLAYQAAWESGQLILSVHDAFAWVSADELLDYNYPPADVPILQELIKGGWLK